MQSFTISGNLIDLFQRRIYPATIEVSDGIIKSIEEVQETSEQYILPGFIDAHIHIESSMLVPSAFARIAVTHGTVATVSDPHEIANVCGIAGVEYMLHDSQQTNFKIHFGAPSCVPATFFETAGAHLDVAAVSSLLERDDIWYLTEVMNYPGVLNKDPEVMGKIAAAKLKGKPIDGHAPGLRGKDAINYAAAGITTDHECFTLNEALDKINAGMHIIIREGSAAKNFEALHSLLSTHSDKVMFCSDDKHPDELIVHHINALVKRALKKGHDLFSVLRAASVNPVLHYNLPVGLLRKGDPADFIVTNNIEQFDILQTYINGQLVAERGKSLLPQITVEPINNFNTHKKNVTDFEITCLETLPTIRVIEAIDGQLVTNELHLPGKVVDNKLLSDTENDILKLVVVNRYSNDTSIAKAFVKNFGLKSGAIASTVAHDCHNIIALGTDDLAICTAVNTLIDSTGGICAVSADGNAHTLPLPIAGLMTDEDGYSIAKQYALIDNQAKKLGSTLHAPFMTLSFMALLVIPSLKLSDKGLFNGKKFSFTPVIV